MTAQFFVDTNVLLYAGSNAPDDQVKRQIARGLLTRPDIGFSAQVLQEFYSAAVPSCSQIRSAVLSTISAWRGTGTFRSFAGFRQIECLPPSR